MSKKPSEKSNRDLNIVKTTVHVPIRRKPSEKRVETATKDIESPDVMDHEKVEHYQTMNLDEVLKMRYSNETGEALMNMTGNVTVVSSSLDTIQH